MKYKNILFINKIDLNFVFSILWIFNNKILIHTHTCSVFQVNLLQISIEIIKFLNVALFPNTASSMICNNCNKTFDQHNKLFLHNKQVHKNVCSLSFLIPI